MRERRRARYEGEEEEGSIEVFVAAEERWRENKKKEEGGRRRMGKYKVCMRLYVWTRTAGTGNVGESDLLGSRWSGIYCRAAVLYFCIISVVPGFTLSPSTRLIWYPM